MQTCVSRPRLAAVLPAACRKPPAAASRAPAALAISRFPAPVLADVSLRGQAQRPAAVFEVVAVGGAPGSGGGLLERSGTDTGRDSEFDLGIVTKSKKKRPPFYKVLLHNDNTNRREYVVKVLMKVIPGMTVDNALNIMNQAHINGIATVITCSQEEAEQYCEKMRSAGLISTVESAGGGGGGDGNGNGGGDDPPAI